MSLQRFWEGNASAWCSWARDPGHDFYFWHFNLPAFLRLIPEEAGRVLDLGCGEGRVARALVERGASVVGVDASEYLARSATSGRPAVTAVIAQGSQLPFADGSFDHVVASMSLHDIADARAATREAARVLVPGGSLCLSIVHPLSSWLAVQREEGADASYFTRTTFHESVSIGDSTLALMSAHRPTEWYFNMLRDGGFQPDALAEPSPDAEAVRRHPQLADMAKTPRFLHMRGRLPDC